MLHESEEVRVTWTARIQFLLFYAETKQVVLLGVVYNDRCSLSSHRWSQGSSQYSNNPLHGDLPCGGLFQVGGEITWRYFAFDNFDTVFENVHTPEFARSTCY